MCGIAGVYNFDISQDLFKECLNRMAHRGPDDSGTWRDETCLLGHRRLSILDISSKGHQPMVSADERFVLSYNGEVYNYIEIREELEKKGYKFVSNSDSEVVLYSFIEWKENCLDKFNGMWAMAVYDRADKRLFLSRDRFGVKPLFYSRTNNGLMFASEMKVLIPMLDKATPNTDIVGIRSKILQYEVTDKTLINEILRLPSGSYAWIDDKGIKIEKWWDTLKNLTDAPDSYEEQVRVFRELFLDSCRIRMRSDVPMGTALSGGLDSSSTICSMDEVIKNIEHRTDRDYRHAYAAVFPGTKLDESEYSDAVADHLKLPYSKVKIDPVIALNNIEDEIYKFEEIYYTNPSPMIQLYSALRKDNVLVTLDGHGADELFGGYGDDLLYALTDAKNREDMTHIMDTWYQSLPPWFFKKSERFEKNKARYKYLAEYYVKKLTGIPGHGGYKGNASREYFMKLDNLNKCLFNETHNETLPTLLRNYDHYSMANGVEIRMPFMDYRVVSFAFSIGWKSKMHGYYTKSIVRDAMKGIVPDKILKRKSKIGFNAPLVEWLRGEWKEWLLDTAHSQDFINCNLIDHNKVAGDINTFLNSDNYDYDMGISIWIALNTYIWDKVVLKSKISL